VLIKVVLNILVALAIFSFGVYVDKGLDHRFLGVFIMFAGVTYILITAGIMLYHIGLTTEIISDVLAKKERQEAHIEVIKLKRLLDANILSQEEFDQKLAVLKKIILQ